MQRRHYGQWQQLAKHADDNEWQRRARGKANGGSDCGEHDDLRQIDCEHVTACCAERLQRRNDVAASSDMALDGIRHSDTPNMKRSEPHQGQKLREAADSALKLWRSIAAASNLPAGLRQRGSHIADEGRRGPIVRRTLRKF